MKKGDFLVLLLILLVAGGIFFKTSSMLGSNGNVEKEVLITVDGKEYKKIGINEEEQIEIVTDLGRNVVGVSGGKARMIESSCKDQLCVKMGTISEINQSIVCLPNRVVITIIGLNTKDDVDVVLH